MGAPRVPVLHLGPLTFPIFSTAQQTNHSATNSLPPLDLPPSHPNPACPFE
jgi:hypothetical protein